MRQNLLQAINVYVDSLNHLKASSAYLEQLEKEYRESLHNTDGGLDTEQAEKVFAAYNAIADYKINIEGKNEAKNKAAETIKAYILAAGKDKSISSQVRQSQSYVTYVFSLDGERVISNRD
jgi:hypothetical protein